jgi:aerobic carbon-monoxide dehydrogenase medium subunit
MMRAFDYATPVTVGEATAAMGDTEAKLLAGGMSLLSAMKLRLAAPSTLVDLRKIPELRGISLSGRSLVIGAMTRHAEVASNPLLLDRLPALAGLAGGIGDRQVRNRGTLGGSLANNDPAACYPAGVLALDATIRTNRRIIAAAAFFKGLYETALEDDEVIISVAFPIPVRAAYVKFPHPASRFALMGAFVADFGKSDIRVALTGAGPFVFRSQELEEALRVEFSMASAKAAKVPARGLNSDLAAAADYRAHLCSVIAGRAVAAILATPERN